MNSMEIADRLIPHDSPDGCCNIRGRQGRGRHLVEQGLEQVEITLVHQNHFDIAV